MTKLVAKIQMLRHSDKGATMVEYGLIVVVIALVVVVGAGLLGDSLSGLFTDISTSVDGVDPVIP